MSPFRERLLGAALLFAFLIIAGCGFGRLIPDAWPVSPVPRLMENLTPHLLLLALVISLVCAVAGARRGGLVMASIVCVTGGVLAYDYIRLSLPVLRNSEVQTQDMKILFFNVLARNRANADRIAQLAIELDPDVAVFAESEAIFPAIDKLRGHFPFAPCPDYQTCDMAVFAKVAPETFELREMGSFSRVRYFEGRFSVGDANGSYSDGNVGEQASLMVYATHLLKPWFSGFADRERTYLEWFTRDDVGPAVMVGDFNLPLWTYALSDLLRQTGFRAERWPLGTWPARLRNWGVPIDHALVRDGARLVSIEAVGDHLGSNHRGILVTVRP